MSNSINPAASGITYFFTLRLANNRDDLLVRKIAALRGAMRDTLNRHPFHIDAIAVLPATIHMLWILPDGDNKYARRVALLKSRFSRACPMPANRTPAQINRGEKAIWQRRYWEHVICDAQDQALHRDLIYLSPVHAGLCKHPQDWPHTSLHRDLKHGAPRPVIQKTRQHPPSNEGLRTKNPRQDELVRH